MSKKCQSLFSRPILNEGSARVDRCARLPQRVTLSQARSEPSADGKGSVTADSWISNYSHFADPNLQLQQEHTQTPDFSLKEGKQKFHSSRQQKWVFPLLTSSLLIDSELNVLRWHRTVMLAISSPETSTTLLQEVVGCNRTK